MIATGNNHRNVYEIIIMGCGMDNMDNLDKGQMSDAEAYEALIKRLRGVLSARVVLDRDGRFEEIHILGDTDRNPKVMVRDIETALLVNFGVTVDHKIISIVQMAEDSICLTPDAKRPQMMNISTTTSRAKVEVGVSLTHQEKMIEGLAAAANTPYNRLRVAATATLDALAKLNTFPATFAVDDVIRLKLSSREMVAVSVFMISGDKEELLLGTAFVKGDEQEAVGKATLCAINRRMGTLKKEK